jgi:hypothetical protein
MCQGCATWAAKEEMFFFEKKNQKTFGRWRVRSPDHLRQSPKVFGFFSSEKQAFLS